MTIRKKRLALAPLFALAWACVPAPDDASIQRELERGLKTTNLAATWLRFEADILTPPKLDWSSEQSLEQSMLDDIKTRYTGNSCVTIAESGGELKVSYNNCLFVLNRVRVNGLLEVEVHGEISAGSSTLETIYRSSDLSIEILLPGLGQSNQLSGFVSVLRFENDPERVEVELRTSGDLSRAYIAASIVESKPCLTLDGLGYTEGDDRLVISPTALSYCTRICPDSGDLGIAGRHLQLLRFSDGSATRSVDEGPYTLVGDELLPCGSRLP